MPTDPLHHYLETPDGRRFHHGERAVAVRPGTGDGSDLRAWVELDCEPGAVVTGGGDGEVCAACGAPLGSRGYRAWESVPLDRTAYASARDRDALPRAIVATAWFHRAEDAAAWARARYAEASP